MANLQAIALDTAVPQLRAPGTGDGYSFDSGATNLGTWTTTTLTLAQNPTLSSGTANQVQFLNVSKVLTGSADFTFNSTGGILTLAGQYNIDNLRMDGNAITSTNANGNIDLTPNGTGRTNITNLTSTSPRFVTSINDTNGNEVFLITATASAVNEVSVTNGATGTGPTLAASGGDTNINLRLAPKGTGQVQELVSATYYSLASQYDVGTAPNQISLNQYLGTMAFQDAVAVSVGQLRANGSGGIGYSTGSGGAVTQATSRTTGVTLNAVNGAITLVSAAGTATWQTFTVTNNTVAATDIINICQKSGTDLYMIHVTAVAAGSFNITFATTGGTTTEQPVFNFAVIKGVTA